MDLITFIRTNHPEVNRALDEILKISTETQPSARPTRPLQAHAPRQDRAARYCRRPLTLAAAVLAQ
jgi:hypothetical protein